MGAILEPTPEMGEWSIEVRAESVYLTGSGYNDYAHANGPEPQHGPRVLWSEGAHPAAFAIPAADCGKVLAALDQALGHPRYAKYLECGLVRLFGSFFAPRPRAPWSPAEAVELPYSSLADLRAHLARSTQTGTRHEVDLSRDSAGRWTWTITETRDGEVIHESSFRTNLDGEGVWVLRNDEGTQFCDDWNQVAGCDAFRLPDHNQLQKLRAYHGVPLVWSGT